MDQQAAPQSQCASTSKQARLLALSEGVPDSHPRAILANALVRACNLPTHAPRLTSVLDFVKLLGIEIRTAKLTDRTWTYVHAMLEIALGRDVSLTTLRCEMSRNCKLSEAREQIKANVVDQLRREIDLPVKGNDQPKPGREMQSSSLLQEHTRRIEVRGPAPPMQLCGPASNPFMGPRRPGSRGGS